MLREDIKGCIIEREVGIKEGIFEKVALMRSITHLDSLREGATAFFCGPCTGWKYPLLSLQIFSSV